MWSRKKQDSDDSYRQDFLSESDLIILGQNQDSTPLTARELRLVQLAAELAVKKMQDSFYKNVGKTVVDRWLIIIGAAVVAFAAGKGWLATLLTAGGK